MRAPPREARVHRNRMKVLRGHLNADGQTWPAEDSRKREEMKAEAASAGYHFPYLYDATQETAHAYRAACTPDFFLFDGDHALVYRGQFDSSRPGNDVAITGEDLKAACDAVLSGQSVADDQMPSIGCNIKWVAGNEPEYFNGQPAV